MHRRSILKAAGIALAASWAMPAIVRAQEIGIGLGLTSTAVLGGSWWKSAANLLDSSSPVVSADFVNKRYQIAGIPKSFSNIITLTSDPKWVVNAAGALVQVSANQPAFDYSTGRSRLLLEIGSTNLFLNSATGVTQNIAVTAQPYTLSFFGTGSITLSGTSSGTLNGGGGGNNRVALTFTPSAGTLTLTVTGSCTSVQLEAQPAATSYIPTTGSSVGRSADVAQLTSTVAAYLQATAASLALRMRSQTDQNAGASIIYNGSGNILRGAGGPPITGTAMEGSSTLFSGATVNMAADIGNSFSFNASGRYMAINTAFHNSDANQPISRASVYLCYLGGASNGAWFDELHIWNFKGTDAGVLAQSRTYGTFNASAPDAWGDSLTSGGQDGTGGTYPGTLSGLLGAAVINNGVAGQTSTQIKNRFIAFSSGYGSPSIFWMGRNNFTAPVTVKADIATCIAALSSAHYLVLGILPSGADSGGNLTTITTLNSDLATLYGAKFVDLLTPLQAAGNGGTNDNADIAAGIVPRSLRASGDSLHLNAAGYTVVANAVYAKKTQLGF